MSHEEQLLVDLAGIRGPRASGPSGWPGGCACRRSCSSWRSGFVAGPVTGFLDPDALFGELLFPLVSLSVGLILFEGGLSLRARDLREIGRPRSGAW